MKSYFLNPGRSDDAEHMTAARIIPKIVHRELVSTIERRKHIRHAKKLGFKPSEIRKFMAYWNK